MGEIGIIYRDVAGLKPYENNPRNNDEAVESVAESIKEFGFKVPMVVMEDGTIIAGHTRLKAAELLGMAKVPVIIADDLDDEQIRAFRLADNKVAEKAEWDEDLLAKELAELENMFTGFDDDEIDALLDNDLDDLENPYTDKVASPQYEMSGEEPLIEQLYDTRKKDSLVDEIAMADVDPEIKRFLLEAATRHTVFNYKFIAEFYAHADEEVQELMERSALVIIDYEDAIRNGYVSLNDDILEMLDNDEN